MAGGMVSIALPINGTTRTMRFWSSDGTVGGVLSPVQTEAPMLLDAAAWSDGAIAKDLRNYEAAEIQVSGLSGGDTITVTRSLDDTSYSAVGWVRGDFTSGTVINSNGIYSVTGGGYLKYAKTGSASTPTITLRAAG